MKRTEEIRDRWLALCLMTIFFLAAAWLRLYHLGFYSLWLDESHTWLFARSSWEQFLPALRLTGVHPPFYFFIEKLIVGLLGDSEWNLRIFSVVANLAALMLASWLGWQVGGIGGMLAAGWFWAFNPFTLWYAQDARPYALVALLSLVTLILSRKIRTRQTPALMLLAGLALMLGLVTHFFFFLPLGALILLALLQMHQSPRLFRRWTAISIIAMLPMALWLVWFFMLPNPSIGIGWISYPTFADPFFTFWNFLSGYGGVFSIPSTIFGILAGFFVILGLVSGEQSLANRRLFLAGIVLPLFLTWLVSFRRPVYVDRYFIVLLPFLIPILASGGKRVFSSIRNILPGALGWSLVAAILVSVGIFNAWQVHADVKYRREAWRELASKVSAQSPAGIPIWFQQPESAVPFEYYFREPYPLIDAAEPPACAQPCWWILRQPYTPTHAFTQSVVIPERPWLPVLPTGCSVLDRWESPTGIGLWKVVCH
jgi:uncharacterized membrane protein